MDIVFVHGKFQKHNVDLNALTNHLSLMHWIITEMLRAILSSGIWYSLVGFYCLEILAYLS